MATLKNYIANGPLTVILFDGRDAAASWARHLRTAGRGGIDLVARVGTPVYAPTDGMFERRPNDGSAGNSCRFWHDDNSGWADVFSHLSAYRGDNWGRFKQGDVIAYSGDTAVPGQPHVHRHLLDPAGNRQNPWLYFNTPSSSVAGATTLITIAPQEADSMHVIQEKETGHVYTIGQQYIRHETWMPGNGQGANFTINVTSPEDRVIVADRGTQFWAILDSFGIPRDKADAVRKGGPEGKGGGVWSAVDEARNDTRVLAAKVDALTKLLTPNSTPAKK